MEKVVFFFLQGSKIRLSVAPLVFCFNFPLQDLVLQCLSLMSFCQNSVTAYSIFDDALKTGEVDCINGGLNFDWFFSMYLCLNLHALSVQSVSKGKILHNESWPFFHYFSSPYSISNSRKLFGTTCCDCSCTNLLLLIFIILYC